MNPSTQYLIGDRTTSVYDKVKSHKNPIDNTLASFNLIPVSGPLHDGTVQWSTITDCFKLIHNSLIYYIPTCTLLTIKHVKGYNKVIFSGSHIAKKS